MFFFVVFSPACFACCFYFALRAQAPFSRVHFTSLFSRVYMSSGGYVATFALVAMAFKTTAVSVWQRISHHTETVFIRQREQMGR
jgi:hypothetical protein